MNHSQETSSPSYSTWILSDGKAGHLNQSLGLAEAMGQVLNLDISIKKVSLKKHWDKMPAWGLIDPLRRLTPESDSLLPPYPDLIIANGRSTAPLAAAIRQETQESVKVIQLQTPPMPLHKFDLVIPPEHDGTLGPNVITSLGALNRVTPEKLSAEAADFEPTGIRSDCRKVAVLIGGSNKHFQLEADVMSLLAPRLAAMAKNQNLQLLVTPSRRTAPEVVALLHKHIQPPLGLVYDFSGPNPYFAYLAWCDAVMVTMDSASMISEACATGKPTYLIELPGKAGKFAQFHQKLLQENYVRKWEGPISFEPPLRKLNEAKRLAPLVIERLGLSSATTQPR